MKYTDYNEKKRHGTAGFPIEFYHEAKEFPQYVMPLHRHPEFEIVYIVSGVLELYLNNQRYEMHRGDAALIQGGTLHRGMPHNCVYQCIVFDLNMLRSRTGGATDAYIMPVINRVSSVKALFHASDTVLCDTVCTLCNTLKNPHPYYEIEVLSLLLHLFSLLYNEGAIAHSDETNCNLRQTRIMTGLLDWIDNHCSEPVSLSELAAVSGFGEKYLCRFFKAYTSRTPIDYINRLRIQNACRDLLDSDCTITDAAYGNGFNDLSYFSKKFKMYQGVSPREFLRLHKQSR